MILSDSCTINDSRIVFRINSRITAKKNYSDCPYCKMHIILVKQTTLESYVNKWYPLFIWNLSTFQVLNCELQCLSCFCHSWLLTFTEQVRVYNFRNSRPI